MDSTPATLCALTLLLAPKYMDETEWAMFTAAISGSVTPMREMAAG